MKTPKMPEKMPPKAPMKEGVHTEAEMKQMMAQHTMGKPAG